MSATDPSSARLFHIASPEVAERLEANGVVEPPSLASEGFVHLSTVAQVVVSTERHFAVDAELCLVELDPERLDDVRWPEVYPDEHFPHLHGPLRWADVIAVLPWGPDDRAAWPD
ncbi:MAG: DUF952 domain-containing protein [Actinomycetota bacterium]